MSVVMRTMYLFQEKSFVVVIKRLFLINVSC